MQVGENYEPGLRRIRRLRAAVAWSFVPGIAVVLAGERLMEAIPLGRLWAVVLAAPILVSLRAWISARCPRCGQTFHWIPGRIGSSNPLTDRCLHCGLPLRGDQQ